MVKYEKGIIVELVDEETESQCNYVHRRDFPVGWYQSQERIQVFWAQQAMLFLHVSVLPWEPRCTCTGWFGAELPSMGSKAGWCPGEGEQSTVHIKKGH